MVITAAHLGQPARLSALRKVKAVHRGNRGELFQRLSHLGTRQPVINAAAAFFGDNQPRIAQQAQMRGGGLRCDPGGRGEFLVGISASLHQLAEHAGATGVPNGLPEDVKARGARRSMWMRCCHALILAPAPCAP